MSGRRLDSRAQLQTCSIAYIIWIITVAIIRVTGVRELTTEHNPTSSKPSWFLWLSWLSSGWLGWGTWRQGTTQHHHNYLIVIIQIIIIVIVITAMLNNRVTGVRDLTTGHGPTSSSWCHHPNHHYHHCHHHHAYQQGEWGEGLDDRTRLHTTWQQSCLACLIFQSDGQFCDNLGWELFSWNCSYLQITFWLKCDDASAVTLTLRTSGTEPKIKYGRCWISIADAGNHDAQCWSWWWELLL